MQLDIERIVRETFVAQAEHLATVGSTNDRAAEWTTSTDVRLPLLVVADAQTAGRGRGSNRWWTGPGSLAFSLLVNGLTAGTQPDRVSLVSLAAGVAVVEAIVPLLPDCRLGLHWPNDVIADGGKLAGILIETLPNRRQIIGIGVNVNNTLTDAPSDLRTTAAAMCELAGRQFDRTDVLIRVLEQLERQLQLLCDEPTAVAKRADQLCLQQGRTLRLQRGAEVIVGCCRGIASDGALRLETAAGIETFYSGCILGRLET